MLLARCRRDKSLAFLSLSTQEVEGEIFLYLTYQVMSLQAEGEAISCLTMSVVRDYFVPFASLWASAHYAPRNDKWINQLQIKPIN